MKSYPFKLFQGRLTLDSIYNPLYPISKQHQKKQTNIFGLFMTKNKTMKTNLLASQPLPCFLRGTGYLCWVWKSPLDVRPRHHWTRLGRISAQGYNIMPFLYGYLVNVFRSWSEMPHTIFLHDLVWPKCVRSRRDCFLPSRLLLGVAFHYLKPRRVAVHTKVILITTYTLM